MPRPALSTLDRLEKLLGGPDALTDRTQAQARLEDASEEVRAYAGVDWLNAEGTAVEDVPPQVSDVVARMVERATLNPEGATFAADGPFSRSFGADAAQRLYLTRGERLIIRRAVGRGLVGTLATSRGNLETAAVRDTYDDLPPLPDGWPQ